MSEMFGSEVKLLLVAVIVVFQQKIQSQGLQTHRFVPFSLYRRQQWMMLTSGLSTPWP